jgi:hypothetical protein
MVKFVKENTHRVARLRWAVLSRCLFAPAKPTDNLAASGP